jgi:LCP family protein required for cell wall assembly
MTDTRSPDELGHGHDVPGTKVAPPGRRRGRLRIALVSLASVTVLLGAAAGGAFFYVNHEIGSIPRIPVKFLAQDNSSGGMTVLLTARQLGPTGLSSMPRTGDESGLIMLLHLNANQTSGGVVSIPPQTEVNVPGGGQMQLADVVADGGPSLLTETVHNLTGVPINHYALIDFTHVAEMVDALGGVSVRLPATTDSFGHVFPKGVDQVDGTEALEYAREPSLTETARVQRQESLMRAVLSKLADKDLLASPLTMSRVLNAFTSLLKVDSTFTNSQVLSLGTDIGRLSSSATTFVTAPTETINNSVVLNPTMSSALWSAISNDSIASFAQQYPDTITPAAP